MKYDNKFFISGYIMPPRTEEAFEDLKNSGLTHIYIDYTLDDEKRNCALNFCDRFGLKAIIMTCWGRYDNPSYKKVTKGTENHISFDGVNGLDEPLAEDFEGIKTEYDCFRKEFPNKIFYINIVNRGVPQRFISNLEGVTHKDMLEKYIELVGNMISEKTVSMTIYPLMHDNDGRNFLNENHLQNLNDISYCAQKSGANMYFFVQAMPFRTTHRKPEESDIRFQVNCGLAFGARGVQYFCYRTPDANQEFSDIQYSMVKTDGEKTDIYYSVKKVNGELKALASDYLPLNYIKTYAVRGRLAKGSEKSFEIFYSDKGLPDKMTYFYSSENSIIGEFFGINGKAYYIVNYTDPSEKKNSYVEFSLSETEVCRIVKRGIATRITAAYGKFCVLLGSGDGILVIKD